MSILQLGVSSCCMCFLLHCSKGLSKQMLRNFQILSFVQHHLCVCLCWKLYFSCLQYGALCLLSLIGSWRDESFIWTCDSHWSVSIHVGRYQQWCNPWLWVRVDLILNLDLYAMDINESSCWRLLSECTQHCNSSEIWAEKELFLIWSWI